MPECKLGLNDKVMLQAQNKTGKGTSVELEDIKFHQCVRLARFENDRTISFIPPDGQFDLMNYRITAPTKPLLWVEANVSRPSRSRVEYTVKLKTQFKARLNATGVEIKLPVPGDATAPEVKAALGAVTYAPEQEAMLWKIKTVPGGKEVLMRAKFSLPSVAALEDDGPKQKKPPITVKYEIPYFTVSGVQVRYLKVIEKSGYQALPWVRYITRSGNYEFRLAHQPAT
jgi:AP-1 complex subunit mu